ncbi:MAG: hypothetical protein HY904_15260 [Deltaproteobacteria bacterium]|nr:hypothetical protein [Deltaproteobacteria bacterium]
MKKALWGVMALGMVLGCGPGEDEHQGSTSSGGSSGQASSSGGSSSGGQACPEVLCDLYCERGFATGADGCPSCACQGGGGSTSSSGGNVCPAIACDARCAAGFRADPTGCPTCECLPGSCDAIFDISQCQDTAGCVPVYFEGGEPVPATGERSPSPDAAFQCCTQADDGVYCGSQPPPVESCWSDADCRAGQVCDMVNYCESACPVDSNGGDTACPAVCLGRCVVQDECWGAWNDQWGNCRGPADGTLPSYCCGWTECRVDVDCGAGQVCLGGTCTTNEACFAADCGPGYTCRACEPNMDCVFQCVPQDCRVSGCGWGEECQVQSECIPLPCDCPVDPDAGACACAAQCSETAVCVPSTNDCRTTGCGYGESCQVFEACPEIGCDCVDGSTDCTCPMPTCEVYAQCVPDVQDCRTTGCGFGETCQVFEACPAIACDCPADSPDCRCAMPPCEVTAQCVPDAQDCRTAGCAAGETCQEQTFCMGGGCACPAGDPNCQPPAPECTTAFVCVAEDPCSRLTETECALDHDLCSPVYATECPPCYDQGCMAPCTSTYAGCATIGGQDAGPAPGTGP